MNDPRNDEYWHSEHVDVGECAACGDSEVYLYSCKAPGCSETLCPDCLRIGGGFCQDCERAHELQIEAARESIFMDKEQAD